MDIDAVELSKLVDRPRRHFDSLGVETRAWCRIAAVDEVTCYEFRNTRGRPGYLNTCIRLARPGNNGLNILRERQTA